MEYQVFYYCHERKKDVPGTAPVTVAADQIPNLAETMLCDEGDFVGIMDAEGVTLQFMATDTGVWLEIPVPEEGGSYGRNLSFVELVEELKKLPPTFDPYKFPTFRFKPWTDDEVKDWTDDEEE